MIDGIITTAIMAGIVLGLRWFYLQGGCRCPRCCRRNPWWKIL